MSKISRALHLVFMMRFEMIDSSPACVCVIERLIEATEYELDVSKSGEKAQQRLAEGMTNVRVCEEILTGCCGR